MMEQVLLASNNEHKHREFVRLFPGVSVVLPGELGLDFDYEEGEESYLANALGKGMALYRQAGRPVIADDSGLSVPALGGEPGIRSSRYGSKPGGKVLEASARNAYLLDRMTGIQDRRAFFVCCLVLVLDENRYIIVQETVDGTITDAPRGVNGFGYDPLFLFPQSGKTMAELSDDEKDWVSHRGRAARRMRALTASEGGPTGWTISART